MLTLPKQIVFLIAVTAALALLSMPAAAAVFINKDEIKMTKNVNDDVYLFGGDITVAGDVHGDLIIGGGQVRVTGTVDGDLMVGGGDVAIDGRVRDTVRVGGGTVVLNGRVGKDVLIGGGDVTLARDSVIGRDLIAGAGNLKANGAIANNLKGGFGTADINGPVGGNVAIRVDRLKVSKNARVKGNLTYESSRKVRVLYGAEIDGKVKRRAPKEPPVIGALRFLNWFWSLMGMLITGLAAAWLFPGTLTATRDSLFKRPPASFGLGVAVLFLTPVAAVLLAIFTLGFGLPLAVIALLAYTVGIYLAQIYAATAVGDWIIKNLLKRKTWIGIGAVTGIAGTGLLRLVPVLGGLVGFSLVVFGLGAMSIACWESWRLKERGHATGDNTGNHPGSDTGNDTGTP